MSARSRPRPRRRTTTQCVAPALVGLTLTVAAHAEQAPPFAFEAPAFLSGPNVSSTLSGSTYAYTARDRRKFTQLLRITIPTHTIHKRYSDMSDVQCIHAFLEEIKVAHDKFFVVAATRPLHVGDAEFIRFRWIGDKAGVPMTGILSCGQLEGYYYVVYFVDQLKAAMGSFPGIRAHLQMLSPRAAD